MTSEYARGNGDSPLASGGLLRSDDGRYLAGYLGCDYIIPAELANRLGIRNLEILAVSIAGDHTEPGESSPTDD